MITLEIWGHNTLRTYRFEPLKIEEIRIIATWLMSKAEGLIDMSPYEESYRRGDAELRGPAGCEGFAVYDDTNALAGLYEYYTDSGELEIGLALAPERRGQGEGLSFVRAGIEFGKTLYPSAVSVNLEVKKQNFVAVAIYKHMGFQVIKETKGSLRMCLML